MEAEPRGSLLLVVGGGPSLGVRDDRLIELADRAEWIVAADSGADHLARVGRAPHWIVGDMDSLSSSLRDWLPAGTRVQRHPSDKDQTDLELALRLVVELGPRDAEIVLAGALGGRMDHSLANLQLVALPVLQGRRLRFVDAEQQAWALVGPASLRIEGLAGDTVSLLPLSDSSQVAATRGLRWPLRDAELEMGPSLGVSNEMTADEAWVELARGRLLCVHIPADSRMLSR